MGLCFFRWDFVPLCELWVCFFRYSLQYYQIQIRYRKRKIELQRYRYRNILGEWHRFFDCISVSTSFYERHIFLKTHVLISVKTKIFWVINIFLLNENTFSYSNLSQFFPHCLTSFFKFVCLLFLTQCFIVKLTGHCMCWLMMVLLVKPAINAVNERSCST